MIVRKSRIDVGLARCAAESILADVTPPRQKQAVSGSRGPLQQDEDAALPLQAHAPWFVRAPRRKKEAELRFARNVIKYGKSGGEEAVTN